MAQELNEVMPEAVTIPEDDEESWSLDASKLVPLAIKGVQEQQGEIQELRAQVQQLMSRVASLEAARSEV